MLGPKPWHESLADPISSFVSGLRNLFAGRKTARFICDRCFNIRKYTQVAIWTIFALIVLGALIHEAIH